MTSASRASAWIGLAFAVGFRTCVMKRSGAAPCRSSSPGSNKTRPPGWTTSIGPLRLARSDALGNAGGLAAGVWAMRCAGAAGAHSAELACPRGVFVRSAVSVLRTLIVRTRRARCRDR